MKILKLTSMVFLVSLFIFSGCKKDEPEVVVTPKYLVKAEEHIPLVAFDIQTAKAIITQYGMTDLASLVNYNFKVFKITYKTAFEGDTINASGIVAVPIANDKKETFPLMSYQHQTLVLKSAAPSKNIDTEQMTYLASTGMVIMISDYIGFGESGNVFHPYLHKEYTNNAVIDLIKATKEFIATEKPCTINEKLFLFGYSQGGGATLGALSEIENNPANSDIKVTATSCGSGAYDLNAMRKWLVKQSRYDSPYLLAYMLESFTKYSKLNIDYSLVFSPKIGPKISGIIDGIASESAINNTIGTSHVGEMLNDDFEIDEKYDTDPVYASIRQAFDANKIDAWAIKSVLAIYYGSKDVTIPSDQSLKLYNDFQTFNVGAKVKLKTQQDKDHITAFQPTLVETIKWFKSL